MEARFRILKKSETSGLIKVRPNLGFSEKNDNFSKKNEDYSEKNYTKESKGKKSKVKKRKENESKENESKENKSGAAAPTGSGWEPSPTAACRPPIGGTQRVAPVGNGSQPRAVRTLTIILISVES